MASVDGLVIRAAVVRPHGPVPDFRRTDRSLHAPSAARVCSVTHHFMPLSRPECGPDQEEQLRVSGLELVNHPAIRYER